MTHPDDSKQLGWDEGLAPWRDGPVTDGEPPPGAPPLDFSMNMEAKRLWAVREEDVVYALEQCERARSWNNGVVKHSNLTGGGKAYAGGELRFLKEDQIIINGRSGRYKVNDDKEMRALGHAFRSSGYHVWCMGFDREAGVPYPLCSVDSEWLG